MSEEKEEYAKDDIIKDISKFDDESDLTEINKQRKRVLYEYLTDFLVFDLEDSENDNDSNLIDNEQEKLKKELTEIPQLYKQKYRNVGGRECEFLQVIKMNAFEQIKIDYVLFPDEFPCLDLRRRFKLIHK